MMFTCLQENLEKGLNIVSKAIPVKSAFPILSNVLIETENGRLKLSSSNQETTISTFVGASIDKEGKITIPAKTLKEFISNLSQSEINANLLNDVLHFSSDRTKSKFNGTNADEFPNLPTFPKDTKFLEVDSRELANTVSTVAFAAATDDSRPVFTGVFMTYKDGLITLAASDGFRLSEKSVKAGGKSDGFTVIIPAKTLMEVARIFSGSTEPIKIALSKNDNLVMFNCEDTTISTRIIDGNYPDYKRIIPTKIVTSAEFLAQDLLEAVKLTSIFAKELNNALKLKLTSEGIKVVSSGQESGEHQSDIPAQIEGDNLEMAFNSKYLLDFLTNVKTEKIVLKASGTLSPCIIQPTNEDSFVHIVMPMQIQ